jgi:O-methyltransferase
MVGLAVAGVATLYLDLLKRMLTRYRLEPSYPRFEPYTTHRTGPGGKLRLAVQAAFRRRGLEIVKARPPVSEVVRREGRDWPEEAETMIGMTRLSQLQSAVEDVIARRVPGDLVEAGVWRGGACILMRAVLAAYDVTDRTVWAADSFQGLPKPNAADYPADAGVGLWMYDELSVSADEVRANFAKYGLLDDRVRFLEGWFKDTLPEAPIDRIAVLRIDGDLYESTIQVLEALHPRVSTGGYVIVDDYNDIPACKAAVDDYRAAHTIDSPLVEIDWTAVYWLR